MDKWIQKSSLSLKELIPSCQTSTLLSSDNHLGFLFSRSSHYLLPILPITGNKNGTKIPVKGYQEKCPYSEIRDRIPISFGKKKGRVLQNYKIVFTRVGHTTDTGFSKWRGVFHLHMNQAGGRIYGPEIPFKPLCALITPFTRTHRVSTHMKQRGI